MTLRVEWATREAARYAAEQYHYAARMPPGKTIQVGVWEHDSFRGAVIFARGAAPNIGRPFNLGQAEVCELVRVALRDHEAPVSQILGRAVRMLRAHQPQLRLVVSYADTNRGHHGGIYQAAGWLYLGTTPTVRSYRDPRTGHVYHSRSVSPSGRKRQFGVVKIVRKTTDLEPIVEQGKHKYVLPLDRQMRRTLEPVAMPYPKRHASAPVGEPPTPSEARRFDPDPDALPPEATP